MNPVCEIQPFRPGRVPGRRAATMVRGFTVLGFLSLAACAQPLMTPMNNHYRLSNGSTTTDLAVWERDNAEATARFKRQTAPVSSPSIPAKAATKPHTVVVSPQKMAVYQSAVADTLRDPESTRFRAVRVVREADGTDALCGELNGKNAYGGYVGYEPFYAPLVSVGNKAVAVLWSSSKVGLETVLEKCGRS